MKTGCPNEPQIAHWNEQGLAIERYDPASARKYYKKALDLSVQHSDAAGHAMALRGVAAIAHATGAVDDARRAIDSALELARAAGDETVLAFCLHENGRIYYDAAQHNEALANYQEALTIRLKSDDFGHTADTLNNIGLVFWRWGDFETTLIYLSEALELRRRTGDPVGIAGTLSNIGNVEMDLDNYQSAYEHYSEALGLAQSGPSTLIAILHYNIATTLVKTGHADQALPLLRQSFLSMVASGDQFQQVRCYQAIGSALLALGDEAQARQELYKGLKLARKLGDHMTTVVGYRDFGQYLVQLQDFDRAGLVLRKALKIAEEHSLGVILPDLYRLLSEVFQAEGKFAEALDYFRRFHVQDRRNLTEGAERRRQALQSEFELEKARRQADLERLRGEQLAEAYVKLEETARRDGMTGLYNHRHLQEQLREVLGCKECADIALLFLDVDSFKAYNDSFGHPAGDAVLREIAHCIVQEIPDNGIAARYGGEEFAILIPHISPTAALKTAERIRASIANHIFPHRLVTASIGVACALPSEVGPNELIDAADRALYAAKRGGRNRVVMAEEIVPRLSRAA